MRLLCLSQAYPQPWPPPPPPPWQPPQETKPNKVLIVIVVLILVSIAAPSAITYFTASGFIGAKDTWEPNVMLSRVTVLGANQYVVDVVGISMAYEIENYKAVLVKDYQVVEEMRPIGNPTASMTFTDLDGDGILSARDYFTITCDPGAEYSLSIIWLDSGNERGSIEWET